jgi:MtrB/PioB family decaheme-associated outer membrane protein
MVMVSTMVALASASTPYSAEASESSATEPARVEGEIVTGPQWYLQEDPNNSAKFSEYREVPNGFVLEFMQFSWRPKANYFLELVAQDVSQLDQRIFLDAGKQDLWKFSFAWTENPRRWTDHAKQLYARQEGSVFTLDDSLQAAVQAAPASVDADANGEWDPGTKGALIKSAIAQGAQDADVGWQRQVGAFGFSVTPNRNWIFDVAAQRERRGGFFPQSLGMYFALDPAEVAAPLEFKTDEAHVGAEYVAPRFNVGGSIVVSEFTTGTRSVTWDDQQFLNEVPVDAETANPAFMRMSPWSNSDLFGFKVYGGASFPGHSRLNASYTQTTTTQDDAFLPKTSNSLLLATAAPLPADSLGGEYDIRHTLVDFSSRPLSWFRYKAWFRNYDYDNQTPSRIFEDYVATDFEFVLCGNANACGSTANRIQRRNLPFGYKKTDIGASAGFRATDWMDVLVAFDNENIDRNVAAVTNGDERTAKLALDFDLGESITIRVTARHQERRADEYNPHYFEESFPIGEAVVAPSNEGERKYMWTDRDRDSGELLFEITPSPKFSVFAEATLARDEYFDPSTGKKIGDSFSVSEDRNFDTIPETYNILLAGRIDDEIRTYTIGGTYTPSERWTLYADYTWENRDYSMASRYRNVSGGIGTDDPLDNWSSDTEDDYDTADLGFDAAFSQSGKWRLNANLSWSKGTDRIHTDFVPGGASSGNTTLTEFPKVETTLEIAQVNLTCSLRKDLDILFRYWFERWNENNFASDFNEPYMGDPRNDPGSAEAVYLGLDFEDYTNQILGFLVRYSFR